MSSSELRPHGSAYTRSQIEQFLEYIELPGALHSAAPSLQLLSQLHSHCITRIPYENLSLHYNASHSISLDPQVLFDKIVVQARGRGGYCMEIALLYHHVLKGLGFAVYTAPARSRNRLDGVPLGDWRSWVHINNIVTFPETTSSRTAKYTSDVAFGGDGPTIPLPLEPGLVHSNLGPQEIRLVKDFLPEQTWRPAGEEGERRKYWIYQYRNGPEKPWNSFYSFLEMEFTRTDWDQVSLVASGPSLMHVHQMIIVTFLGRRASSEDQLEVYGKRMLVGGVVKENLGGKTQVVLECRSEAERVDALRKFFRMNLTPEEISGIKGYKTELQG